MDQYIFRNQNLLDRTKKFSVIIVKMTDHFPKKNPGAWKIAEQITDSSMSIYANLRESQSARSKKEFVSICAIALREANETHGWLLIINDLFWINKKYTHALIKEIEEICKIIASIIIKTKQ